MNDKAEPVPMKRFWFTSWREDVLFHADPHCRHLENNVTDVRNPDQLPMAHIPIDIYDVGSPPELKFCSDCDADEAFDA